MNDFNILVFKTNISRKKDLGIIEPVLSSHDPIIKWNVDMHDIDKILRVESTCNDTVEIIKMVNNAGYDCEELED